MTGRADLTFVKNSLKTPLSARLVGAIIMRGTEQNGDIRPVLNGVAVE